MPTKNIRFDYFKPCLLNDPKTLIDLTHYLEILSNSDQEDRVIKVTNVNDIRVCHIQYHKNYHISDGGILQYPLWEIRFTRTRYDIPGVYNKKTQQINPANLDDDEYVAEETSFLYDKEKNIVILQRNRAGASPNTVQRFFNTMYENNENPIELQPIIKSDSLKRAMNDKYFSTINVRFPNVSDDALKKDKSVQSLIDAPNSMMPTETDCQLQAEFIFKVIGKNKKKSLLSDSIKKLLWFLSPLIKTDKVDKLIVKGKQENERAFEEVDLIKDVVRDFASFDVTVKNRYIASSAIYNSMVYFYSQRRHLL